MGILQSVHNIQCCFLLLTLFLCSNMGPFYRCAVLLEEIAPAARKPAPVRAPKHRLQLLIGACSCVRSPWAVASIRASLPAPERGFSTQCRWVCAPLWSSKGRRGQLVSPWSSSPGSAQAVEKGCSCPTSQHGLAEPDRESGAMTVSHLHPCPQEHLWAAGVRLVPPLGLEGFREHKHLKEAGHWQAQGPCDVNHSGGIAVVHSGYWLLRALWHLLGMNAAAPFVLFSPSGLSKFSLGWAGARRLGCPWQMAQGLSVQVPLTGSLGPFPELEYPWH